MIVNQSLQNHKLSIMNSDFQKNSEKQAVLAICCDTRAGIAQ
jgi:hypothetical protein